MSSFYNNVKHIFTLLIYIYGVWYGFVINLSSFQLLGIIPPIMVYVLVYFIRIPKPNSTQVEQIVGKDPSTEPNQRDLIMTTVAHRGAGLDVPENSLIAFKTCAEKGCNFIEFDVCLTKDNVAIVFHDNTLERMAGIDKLVSESRWNELQNVDISVNHPMREKFPLTRIPTFDEAIRQMLADGQHMFIDIKQNDHRMVEVILNTFKKYPQLHEMAVVSTFFPNLIYKVRKANPKIVCSMAFRPYFFSHSSYSFANGVGPPRASTYYGHLFNCFVNNILTWALPRFTYYILGLSIILLHKDCISPEIIDDWRKKGVRVCIWTVNHPLEKQYFYRHLNCTYLTDTLIGENTIHAEKNN